MMMDGDRAIAKILKAEGVEWMAAFPAQTLIDAVAMEGIRPIICRQERTGVNMADGYSRVMNGKKIGVFSMQRGPGAENAFGGVAQAYADNVPILVLPGGHDRDKYDSHPGFDAVDHYGGITKWAGYITNSERIPALMGRAFSLLKHGRPAPVLVEIPSDVAVGDYPGRDVQYMPVKVQKSSANPDDVRDLVTDLLKAKAPVINAGQGVMYAEATDDLIEFAELVNVPVMTTLAGKSAFPENHPLALGTGGHSTTLMVARFLEATDFFLAVGAGLSDTHFNSPTPQGVPIGQVTNAVDDLNKNVRLTHGAVGDAKLVLRQMIEEVKRQLGGSGRGDVNGVVEEVASIKTEFMTEWEPHLNSDEVPISPYRVLTELAKAVDVEKAIVTHDSGYPREQFVPFWPVLKPHNYIGWGKSTQLGYGLGLAIGAKLAKPDHHSINVMGDAAFGMSGLDIETAARCNIGILTVVLNNGVMTHYDKHMPFSSKRHRTNVFGGDYAKVAEGLGAYSEQVETPDALAGAFKRAIDANTAGQPALIEVMTKAEENVPNYLYEG